MEKRKDSLCTIKLCRFCLSQDEPLQSLYDRSSEHKNSVPLPLKILSSVSVEVFPSDKMPLYICNQCRFFMDLTYGYKQICRQADESILQFVQTGTPLEPIVWPPSLVKAFRSGARMLQDVGVVKTVVEGGATVEVTSQEMSDSEDDDENVYNVKIGDGLDEGSACIKVVKSKEHHSVAKTKPKGSDQVYVRRGTDSDEGSGKGAAKAQAPEAITDGCWACDECECTYSLQQLLELHKMQKHRARNVPCDQCDAKFFTKYDLMTHQLRHSDEMPFQCVACDRMFKRLVLLKRHERLMHSDLPQLKCPRCPATFLSVEELEAHQSRHNRYSQRPFACTLCDKMFRDKGALQRHKDTVHVERPELSCEYCPEQFASVSKLTRHVRSHAGERPYPCKYCDKSFLKSHHYTRHLRMKHRETVGGTFGVRDPYRCEQCEDTFGTQDDLIYHSAIHATQNLTCPLCQEKFEDVDAVTAHIKSHVNGMEFMCDYCELVFTSKEKLDSHIAGSHEDEATQLAELDQNESSMEMDAEEDEDDNAIYLKEEDDHMVVEIKKADDFMITNPLPELEEKMDNTNSEESESEFTYVDLATVDTLAIVKKEPLKKSPPDNPLANLVAATITPKTVIKVEKGSDSQTASILRRAEEIQRKVVHQQSTETSIPEKRDKPATLLPVSKVESSSSVGGNDKSLRLLEKELQELKRTTSRNDASKTPAKTSESARSGRRPQLHTSTPKLRSVDEKKPQASPKTPAVDKKLPERRAVKENKEPKEGRDAKPAPTVKEEKEVKPNNSSVKEERETREIDTPKSVVKNGTADRTVAEDSVRRSTRPSKIKDYAKMIRERSDDDDSDDDDDEYVEADKTPESRLKSKRGSVKPPPKVVKPTPPAPGARKRGRPRREPPVEVPVKVKKSSQGDNENEETSKPDKIAEAMQGSGISKPKAATPDREKRNSNEKEEKKCVVDENSNADTNKIANADHKPPAGLLVSPTGQTLKKVPIRSLPPGVRPIPLPANARTIGAGELCEMQIGKKLVKVQKIVVTKAEVEAMAKKGLVEMKDGTMVLKQGIKLPTSDPVAIKSSLVGEGGI